MKNIKIEDCVRIDLDLFFIDSRYNIIYKMNMKTGEVSVIGSIPQENVFSSRLSGKIVHSNGCLYFAPMNAKKIWSLDLNTNQWRSYELKSLGESSSNRFFQLITYKNKLFFIGCEYPAIVILNLDTGGIEYFESPYLHLCERKKSVNDCYFRCDYVLLDNMLYLASCVSNEILKFNLDTYGYEFLKIGDEKNRFVGIAFDGTCFCLAPRNNSPIIFWDGRNVVDTMELPKLYKQSDSKLFFGGICYYDEKFYLPAVFDDNSIVLEKEGEKYIPQLYKAKHLFYHWIDSDTLVYVVNPYHMRIVYKGNLIEHDLLVDDSKFDDYFIAIAKKGDDVTQTVLLVEDDNVDLKLLIKSIDN